MMIYTIIIPARNAEGCIVDCLASIFRQTFDSYEVILVDGLSIDDTVVLSLKCAAVHQNKKMRIIPQRGKGIYGAMNEAIAASRGQFLLFLGADDALLDATVLGCVHDHIQSLSSPDVVIGDVLIDGIRHFRSSPAGLTWRNSLHHQGIFYSKSLFERIGVYREDMRIYGDYEFNLRMRSHGVAMHMLPFPVARAASTGVSGRPLWANCREQMMARSLHVSGVFLWMANAVTMFAYFLKFLRLR